MLVLTYGLYDSIAKEYVRTFTSKNDDVAQRAADYIVREPNFDKIAGKDFVINYLYTMDTESGVIVDNNIHVVCALAGALANFENEVREQKLIDALNKGQEKREEIKHDGDNA